MKMVNAMFLSSICAFAIDCTTIDIEAEKTRLQNEMDVTSPITNPLRVAQRKETEAFKKCLLFQDLKKIYSYKRAKALQSISRLRNLKNNEKKLYDSTLKSDIAIHEGLDFESIGHKNVKHIYYSIEEDRDNNIAIVELFLKNKKIESTMKQIPFGDFQASICTKDTLTKRYIEHAFGKEFQCEVPESQEYYVRYELSQVKSHLPVGDDKILKNTEVAIVKATNLKVRFCIINEHSSNIYEMERDTFDKYFTKVDLLKYF